MSNPLTFYRRHLPHFQPEEAAFHIVFRLSGSLPGEIIKELKLESEHANRLLKKIKNQMEKKNLLLEYRWKYFNRFDSLLDKNSKGPQWLNNSSVAEIVKESIHYRDRKEYDLLAYCIMPNHVHLVINVSRVTDPAERIEINYDGTASRHTVTDIIGSLKKYTALRSNRILHRSGAFWQDESYDHVIRDESELEQVIRYVMENPVKAGLVNRQEKWQWTYCKQGILQDG